MPQFLRRVLYLILGVALVLLAVSMHEIGHLVLAIALGVQVSEFSVGFGPLLAQAHYGIDWSLRALPLGGYCLLEDMVLVSWRAFIVLTGGVLVNFASWAVCKRIADKREEGSISFDNPEWMSKVPWHFGGPVIRLFGFPFVVMWRLGVEVEEGDLFRAFGEFHLMLGIFNLLPLFPFVDGSKVFAIIMTAGFGGGDTAALLWMSLGPVLLFLGLLGLVKKIANKNKQRFLTLENELAAHIKPEGGGVVSRVEGMNWEIVVTQGGFQATIRGSMDHLPKADDLLLRLAAARMQMERGSSAAGSA